MTNPASARRRAGRPFDVGAAPADSMPGMPPAYHRDRDVTLYDGDTVQVLRRMPADSVDCVVTSPPYWRLRDYATATWTGGHPDCRHTTPQPALDSLTRSRRCSGCAAVRLDGQYGLEATPTAYIDTLRRVCTELARVLAVQGTMWLNLGDSYSTNSDGYWCAQPGQPHQPRYRPVADVPFKNLIGMPWRVALALQSDGWILRNAVVWHKPNATPTPVRDRLACRYEWLFLLVRQPRYYFDLDPIRAAYTGDRPLSRRAHRGGTKPHTARGVWPPPTPNGPHAEPVRGRNPGDVWPIPTRPHRHTHPAAFPVEVPLRAIAAGCPPHGVVLDPFSGTGTTGLAARALGRAYVGIDLNPAYHDIALSRLATQSAPPDPHHRSAA
jgi:DNA modification methylase